MIEYIDYYDEFGTYLGKEDRNIVHRDALWHKTVHCWLYDSFGNVFFQIRKEEGTLYTTASGHLQAGETVEEGFRREIFEEIGVQLDSKEATLVEVVPFKMDKVKKDGSIFKDRVWANVYVDLFDKNMEEFHFDPEELSGLVKVNAKEALELFHKENGSIMGEVITFDGEKIVSEKRLIDFKEFLVNEHETAFTKYGKIMEKVIELTA